MFTKNFLTKILFIPLIGLSLLKINEVKALIPYYSFPSEKFLKKNSSKLGKNAYQLLYFGQLKEALSLAELAVNLDPENEKLWVLLAEIQINNKLYDDALISIKRGKIINPSMSELYFAESSIFLNKKKIKQAKQSLKKGVALQPNNTNALFQLGNIFFLEKSYKSALNEYDKIIKIDNNFWQALNNKGLIYFEKNERILAISNFKKALKIENNAEPMLALAVCLQNTNRKEALLLTKKALRKNPNYVSFEFRKEQLWGNRIQEATNKLFEFDELKQDIEIANIDKN